MAQIRKKRPQLFTGNSVRAMAGFALYWAWLDALLFGATVAQDVAANALVGDFALQLMPLVSIVAYGAFYFSPRATLLLGGRQAPWLSALLCATGSLCAGIGGAMGSAGVAMGGFALAGLGLAPLILLWIQVYATDPAGDGYVWVAGSIALSFPVVFLISDLSSGVALIVIVLLPLASAAILRTMDRGAIAPCEDRPVVSLSEQSASGGAGGRFDRLSRLLVFGYPWRIAAWIFVFAMVFGLMQHYFGDSSGPRGLWSVSFAQGGRALAALIFFVMTGVLRSQPHVMYRLALVFVLLGFSAMPLLESTNAGWAEFAANMAYGCFECIAWSLVISYMFARKVDVGLAAGGARILMTTGALAGFLVVFVARAGLHADAFHMLSLLSLFVCLLVMSTMLVMEGGAANMLRIIEQAHGVRESARQSGDRDLRETCLGLKEEFGLTDRETDILILLAQGRSAPYIGNALFISPDTANTHKRHIYTKLDVHNRQQLIDLVEARR